MGKKKSPLRRGRTVGTGTDPVPLAKTPDKCVVTVAKKRNPSGQHKTGGTGSDDTPI